MGRGKNLGGHCTSIGQIPATQKTHGGQEFGSRTKIFDNRCLSPSLLILDNTKGNPAEILSLSASLTDRLSKLKRHLHPTKMVYVRCRTDKITLFRYKARVNLALQKERAPRSSNSANKPSIGHLINKLKQPDWHLKKFSL